MMAWVDGRCIASGDAPKPATGRIAPFETMGAHGAQIPLWGRHMKRLAAAARRLGLEFAPTPELRAAASELLLETGHADGILRLALVPGDDAVHLVMTSRLRSPATTVRLLPTIVERPASTPPGDIKAYPRGYYDRVLQQAQDGGADDGIVIGEDGAVLETALANLWLLLDGVWTTPALDGRVLPGIAREILLERAGPGGVATEERRLDLGDLHRAEALATSNAVYGPRAAGLAGAAAPCVPAVAGSLGRLWAEPFEAADADKVDSGR